MTIALKLQLTRPDPAVGITGFNAALRFHTVWGSAQCKIVDRRIGKDATGVPLPDAKWVSTGIDPVTGDEYDRVVGNVLSPKSLDVGLYNENGFWDSSTFPATVCVFILELTHLGCGDVYDISIGDPGTGIVVADNSIPIPNAVPVRRISVVRVMETPEPASALLLAAGGLFLRRRRA